MIVFPNAKINLGLHVLEKRKDGYHAIETLFLPVSCCDILEIEPSKTSAQFTYTGIPLPGNPAENLCQRAYALLAEEFSLPPVQLHLHKMLPNGAGMGGGSADAAFTLRTLNEIFKLGLSRETLSEKALQIGSDCPFFIYNTPMLARGMGEVLEKFPIDVSAYFIGIVKPPVAVSTAAAYRQIQPKMPAVSLTEVLKMPIGEWRGFLTNDFEEGVFRHFPHIQEVKEKLYAAGAIYASMSGSGSAVFGIFEQEPVLYFPADYWLWKGKAGIFS